MNNKIISLLKDKNYVLPEYLLKNYKNIGLNSDELLFMIYLINIEKPIVCNYKLFSESLNMNEKDILILINNLKEKGMINVELKKNIESKLEEYINLDNFFNKLFMTFIEKTEDIKEESNIYAVFEKELGRTLSPIEYELINGWLECNYKEEIILSALKEAVFNGVNNFRYIDKILFEWNKKGIDTLDKIEKNKKDFKKENIEEVTVPDYDWLNEDE